MNKKETKISKEQLTSEAITLHVAGLSVREIAKQLGTSPATISRILKGKTPIPTTTTIIPPAQPAKDPIGLKDSVAPKALVGTHAIVDTNTMAATNTGLQLIVDKAHTAVTDIIRQIQNVVDGETDVAKLATAADKLSVVAERLTNITRLANQQSADATSANTFINDFASRHLTGKNKA